MESGDLQIVIQNADTEIVGYHTAGFGSALFFQREYHHLLGCLRRCTSCCLAISPHRLGTTSNLKFIVP